ncbi:MAG: hypothetical protein IJR85_03075 [Synergistaceae bacterium]|nr:hypothetical protein [Synergistaceae bacterium]
MKKVIILLGVLAVLAACPAFADTPAREGMIAYSGTEAFTKLAPDERQACTSWLVYGGEMDNACKNAVLKLTSEAPDAVTAEQRQALIAAASGNASTTTAKTPAPVKQEEPKTEIKKDDNTGKYLAAGVLGVVLGMVIHNNVGHRHRNNASPVYQPEPPRPAPSGRTAPPPYKAPQRPTWDNKRPVRR